MFGMSASRVYVSSDSVITNRKGNCILLQGETQCYLLKCDLACWIFCSVYAHLLSLIPLKHLNLIWNLEYAESKSTVCYWTCFIYNYNLHYLYVL